MKSSTKLLAFLLALVMLIPMSAMAEERPTISVFVPSDSAIPTEEASVPKAIGDAIGVNLDCIYVSRADASSKLSAMIAAGTLPDVFHIDAITARDLITYGAVLDMHDLIYSQAPNIVADGEERLKIGINTNGAIYGLPQSMSYPQMMAVRRDYMAKCGVEVPDGDVMDMNLSDFKQLMIDFAQKDPDGNGKDDTFGFCFEDSSMGMISTILGAYGLPIGGNWDAYYYDEAAGECFSILKHPGFLTAAKDFRELYKHGGFDPEFATVADATTEFGFLWNGTAGAASWSPAGMTNNWRSRYTQEGVDENSFIYVNIIDDETKTNGGYVIAYNNHWVMISANCKNPEAAIKFLDYMYSEEGGTLAYLGIEGVHYEWTDKETLQYKYLNQYAEDITNQRSDGGYLLWQEFHNDNNFELRSLTPITVEAINFAKAHQTQNGVIVYTTPACASEIGTTTRDTVMQCFANLIVAEEDQIDAMYQQYVDKFNTIGGRTYEQELTAIYKAENGI